MREDVREIIKTLCNYKNVEIIAGAVCVDHVHLSVAIPPKLSISSFMGYLKGKSTLMIYDRHPELQSKWNKAFWARGYYVETIGNITDEAVQKYIKEQAEESRKDFCRIFVIANKVIKRLSRLDNHLRADAVRHSYIEDRVRSFPESSDVETDRCMYISLSGQALLIAGLFQ